MKGRAVVCALSVAILMLASRQAKPDSTRAQDVGVEANAEQHDRMQKAIEPLMKQARETYPQAKKKFLAGLPKGYLFQVVAPLTDKAKKSEFVFITVRRIADGFIEGSINNEIRVVSGYRLGDFYRLLETEIVDWCIVAPDGSEEGNIIGKWLETHPGPH